MTIIKSATKRSLDEANALDRYLEELYDNLLYEDYAPASRHVSTAIAKVQEAIDELYNALELVD